MYNKVMEAVDEILSKLERKIEKKIKSQMTHNECQCVTLDERVNLEAVKPGRRGGRGVCRRRGV